jgi:hypothetical protein
MLSVPGQWWLSCYSPPDLMQGQTISQSCPGAYEGAAQFPDKSSPPPQLQGLRHLTDSTAPPNRIGFYSSDIAQWSTSLHRGGTPSTPGNGYSTIYQTSRYTWACGCWQIVNYTSDANFGIGFEYTDRVQYYITYGANAVYGWTIDYSSV